MRAITRRVHRLEEQLWPALEAMRKAAVPAGPSGAEVLRANLARLGIEQGPNESLAETAARAMGISYQQFRRELMMRARL
jgi:hypothetical protein